MALKRLADCLYNKPFDYSDNYYLAEGKTGLSLFFFYCGKEFNNRAYTEYAYALFEESFLALNNYGIDVSGKSLFGGYTGVLWLYQHYINVGFIEYDIDAKEVFSLFDKLILKEIMYEKEIGNYDLFYGFLGYGVYFLERNKHSCQKNNLIQIIDALEATAIRKEKGIAWRYLLDYTRSKNQEYINLGYAHGLPSILVFLAYAYQLTKSNKAMDLINGCMNYLRSSEMKSPDCSSFSYGILDEFPDAKRSRLAWCYGDLGIGYAILKTGVLVSNKQYQEYGIKILKKLENIKLDNEYAQIKDAGFCHGTAGISHLFHKAHQYSNEKKLAAASKYWTEQTLKMATKEGDYSSYDYSEKNKKWEYKSSMGLLEGSAGVGMCMLSQLDLEICDWDLCLLL